MPTIPSSKPLQPRNSFDNYPTDERLCRAALQLVPLGDAPLILDPGAGAGPWGKAARALCPGATIHGIELRDREPVPEYNEWHTGNFAEFNPPTLYDHVIGNFPYDDWWNVEQKQLAREAKARGEVYKRPARPADLPPAADAEFFIRKAISLTKEGGYIVALLRLAFLASSTRGRGLFKEFSPERVYTLMQRPSFIVGNGTDSDEYAIFIWRVGYKMQVQTYMGYWLDWR